MESVRIQRLKRKKQRYVSKFVFFLIVCFKNQIHDISLKNSREIDRHLLLKQIGIEKRILLNKLFQLILYAC
jgi:hypothetical protein